MKGQMMAFPEFYDPTQVGTLYVPNTTVAITAGNNAGVKSSDNDSFRTALLLIDAQVDFIHTDGALSVPGAVDDTRRTIEWLFNHIGEVTTIIASLDSHTPIQIFSPSWWVNAEGRHPDPFTIITSAEVQSSQWRALYQASWSGEYVERLEEQAKKQLMIWPYHTLIGTPGHTITPALYEAIAYHTAARKTQPRFVIKGTIPETENYSIFEPEVKMDKLENGGLNTALLDELATYDRVYVAGQAKSHCVLESVTSMMRYFDGQPEIIEKIYLLKDAMSSVVSPGIDFDVLADKTYAQFAEHGLNITTTNENQN
jgi:nicotinamidase/pyrazinamidase